MWQFLIEPMQWQFYSTKSSIEESRGVPFVREVCRAIWWCVQCPQIAHAAVVGEHGWPKREVSLDTVRSALLSIKAVVCLFFAGNGGKTLEPKNKTKLKPKQTHAPAMMLWMMKAPEVVCALCDNQFNSRATQHRLWIKNNLFTSISCVSF